MEEQVSTPQKQLSSRGKNRLILSEHSEEKRREQNTVSPGVQTRQQARDSESSRSPVLAKATRNNARKRPNGSRKANRNQSRRPQKTPSVENVQEEKVTITADNEESKESDDEYQEPVQKTRRGKTKAQSKIDNESVENEKKPAKRANTRAKSRRR